MRRCERVYLESYTSILMVSKERLVCERFCDGRSRILKPVVGTGSVVRSRGHNGNEGDGRDGVR